MKVGDRVVLVSDRYVVDRGDAGKLSKEYVYSGEDRFWSVIFTGTSCAVWEKDLELEDVYKSPLYEALK